MKMFYNLGLGMPVPAWLAYASYYFGYKEEAFPLLYTTKHLDPPYDERQIICLRKSEVYVKKNETTLSNVTEKMVELSIHCLPCSYTNDVINISS